METSCFTPVYVLYLFFIYFFFYFIILFFFLLVCLAPEASSLLQTL